jgi:hypothetical protein
MKSLKINIINDNELIVQDNILIDDSIKIIKQKLFANHNTLIPNLLKFEIKNDNNGIITNIKNDNDLLFNYFDEFDSFEKFIETANYTLHITKLINDIINYDIDISEAILDDFVQSEKLLNILQQNGYYNLKEEDLLYIIKYILTNTTNSNYIDDINNYLKIMSVNNNTSSTNETLDEYYKQISNLDFTNVNIKCNISEISLNIKGNNIESGSKGIFIKLHEIFNVLKLTNDIPLIALSRKDNLVKLTDPQIKVLNASNISDKDIRNWILNEKKKINQSSYKSIKGLLIKSFLPELKIYITFNILQNGLITVNCKLPKIINIELQRLKQLILIHTDNIIKHLNTIGNVFLHSRRINQTSDSSIKINSIDSIIETDYINRFKFVNFINKEIISDNILEHKIIASQDILSMYYKKLQEQDDIKGITINIRDYYNKTSLINIFSADNYNQVCIILAHILTISKITKALPTRKTKFGDESVAKQIEKSNKKKLKEQGLDFNSRNCQADRQPSFNNDPKLPPLIDNSYLLDFEGNNFRCNHTKYPYPGFTDVNAICCFKTDRRDSEEFLRNIDPDSLNIYVEPSNFKILIEQNNEKFETLVIKIESDEILYYFLSPFNNHSLKDLIPITDKNLITTIENENNIFLDKVPLSQIIYPTSSQTKCKFNPDLNNRTTNINSQCSKHKDNEFFGYTKDTIPCCFNKMPDRYVKAKNQELSTYIFTTGKLLNNNRLGNLIPELNQLFNVVFKHKKDTFYRMGTLQNNNAFLNVLLLAMNSTINGKQINNCIEFKKYIYKYLHDNNTKFIQLNNGNISTKYNTIDNYIKSLAIKINWYETIELLETILKRNIFILDVNQQLNSKILCRPTPFNQKNSKNPFIILIKSNNAFELIVNMTSGNITKNFNIDTETPVIKFLIDYYKDTCIIKNVYPANFEYIPLLQATKIIELIGTTKNDDRLLGYVKYQIKNNFNKINMLITSSGFLIPIIETGIITNIITNIQVIALSDFITQNALLSSDSYKKILKKFNTITNQKVEILDKVKSNIKNIGGLFTNYGFFIPYRIKQDETEFNSNIKYYIDIDEKLSDINIQTNDFTNYSNTQDIIKNKIYDLRKQIGTYISNNTSIKDTIEQIILQKNIDRYSKINKIFDILLTFNLNNTFQQENHFDIILKSIANEICNDNKENLILNNIITTYNFNKKNIIKHDSESVLLNIDDIYTWIKEYKTN